MFNSSSSFGSSNSGDQQSNPFISSGDQQTQASFSFGGSTNQTTQPPSNNNEFSFGSSASASATNAAFSFADNTTQTQSTFGVTGSTQPISTGFSFGAVPSTDTTHSGGFSFGAQPSTGTGITQSAFGTTSQPSSGSFSFSTPSETNNQPSTGFSFGSPPSTTNNESSTGFGTTTTTFGATGSTQPTSSGFSFGAPPSTTNNESSTGFGTTKPSGGFNFGDYREPTNTPPQQPTVAAFNFGTSTGNTAFGANPQPTFGGGFGFGGFSTVNNIAGFITIPTNAFSYGNNDFHDLNIEIYDENGLFTNIKTHRIKVGANNGILANLVKNSTKKNDMYTVEISTSFIPESIFGKIKASALQNAITSYFQTSTARVDDVFQILIVMDYLGIPTFQQLVSNLTSNFSFEHTARLYLRSFNEHFSKNLSFPSSDKTACYFSLAKAAFNVLINGKDLENQMTIKELHRSLFETQLQKEFNPTELPAIMGAIDVWVVQNFASSNMTNDNLSYQIISLLDNLQIKQPQATLMMIQLLSSNSPPYSFINAISSDWKLKLINKYSTTTIDWSPFGPPQSQPRPFTFAQPQPQSQPPQPRPFQTQTQPVAFGALPQTGTVGF